MLYCHPEIDSSHCQTDYRPWADGTPCRDKRNYWCKRGQCVHKTYRIPVVHGEWGEWQPYGSTIFFFRQNMRPEYLSKGYA